MSTYCVMQHPLPRCLFLSRFPQLTLYISVWSLLTHGSDLSDLPWSDVVPWGLFISGKSPRRTSTSPLFSVFLTLIKGNSVHSNFYMKRKVIVRFKLAFCLKEAGKVPPSCEEADLTSSWQCHIMME